LLWQCETAWRERLRPRTQGESAPVNALTGLPILESQLQSQLHQSAAWGPDQPADGTFASRNEGERGSIKMSLVEEIKNLPPPLQIDPLGWFENLLRGKIGIEQPRPNNGVSSQVAEAP
jgi:hypothetical protein